MSSNKKSMHNHLVDESGYEVWRDYSGRHTYLTWDRSKHLSGSGVPPKYQGVWKIMAKLGKYLSRKKKSGLVFDLPFSSVMIDFYESEKKDWNMKVRGVATMVNGEKYDSRDMERKFSNQEYSEIRKKNKQAVLRALKGLRVVKCSIYDDDIHIKIKKPSLSAPKPVYKTTEVFVSDGSDSEMVLYALERQLGFYPSDFEILSSDNFEDDEDIVTVRYKKGSLAERVASRYLQSNWNEYDDDDGVEIETPSEIVDEKVDLLSKQVKPLVNKMVSLYKRMGFKVRIWENDGEFSTYEDNLTTIMYQFELSLKGGQKIVIDRKQMVASGNYKFAFEVYFHSDDNVEIEQGLDPYSVQVDVDDFKDHSTWYYVPSSSFEYFAFGGDDLDRMGNQEYSAREIEKACKESVYFLFKDLNGKWRKKRASDLVQRVALLKLQNMEEPCDRES